MTDASSRVAIVTGASRGIGRATAIQLSRSGWRIVAVARSARPADGTLAISRDIKTGDACRDIVAETISKLGRLDALVNNAGYAPLLELEQTTDEIWRDAIDINLSSAFYLSRACWPHFRKQGGGVIVNVSSAAARDPFAGFIAYGAAKAALNNLGLSLAREGAKDNIRVHTIAPSATETEMFRSLPGMADFPRDSTMSPDDVARVIVQCITGELAHTSGEAIYLHKLP